MKAGGNAGFFVLHSVSTTSAVVLRESGGTQYAAAVVRHGAITAVSGILDRPVPSTPRLRRGFSLWLAGALAEAASRTMTAVAYSPHSRAILASAQPSQ
jgi:hypothetical protein